jgi:hypothetical protein
MTRHVQNFCFFCFTLLSLSGCKREERTTWNSGVLVPLVEGSMYIDDLVPDSILSADENYLWHLILVEDLTEFNLDTLVRIPDTTISKRFDVPIIGGPFPIPPGQIIINEEENNQLGLNGVELREIRVKSGFLQYSIRSYINGYLQCNYELPGVTLNGVGTVIEATTQPSVGVNPYVFEGSIDLSHHQIDLTGESGTMFNRIYTHLTIQSLVGAPAQTLVSGDDSVVVELRFVDPVIEYARGYFGQHVYQLNQDVDFSDEVHFPDGSLNLQEATMKFHLSNAVGADARIEFTELSNYNLSQNSSVSLDYNPLFAPLNITRALDNNGVVVPTSYDFEMNELNSNIVPFIENLPNAFSLQGDISINPLGDISGGNDFIYSDNALQANLEIDIPLLVGIDDLTFIDTLAIASQVDLVADGSLYLYTNNYFPFSATCNAYLINQQNQFLSTLIYEGTINAAIETNVPGSTLPVESRIRIPLNEKIIAQLNEGNRVVIKMVLNSMNYDQPSGLYENYRIDYRIIGDADVEMGYN